MVFSHSFVIAEGTDRNEPFFALFGEILGTYGVFVFFILSGYLVSESAARSSGVGTFLVKRAGRIFPGFIICNLLVTLLICPLFAMDGPRAFLLADDTWSSVARTLMFRTPVLSFDSIAFFPPMELRPYLSSVANGVLWTIPMELSCYLFLAVLLVAGIQGMKSIGTGVLLCCAFILLAFTVNSFLLGTLAKVFPSFVAGMVLREVAQHHRPRGLAAAGSALVLAVIALSWPRSDDWVSWVVAGTVLFPALAAYPLLWLGCLDTPFLRRVRRLGDPSYGIYLWGWPIQQVLRSLVGPDWSGYGLSVLAMPIVFCAGYFSWFYFERPFLRLAHSVRWPKVAAQGE